MLSLTQVLTLLIVFGTSALLRATENEKSVQATGAFELSQWEPITPTGAKLDAICKLEADGNVAIQGKPQGYIQTTRTYANYRLQFEWRWTKQPGNSGLLLNIDSGPIDRNVWPRSLQIQMKHNRVGDVLPMAGATFAEPLSKSDTTRPPQIDHLAADSESSVGEWNQSEVICRAGSIEFWLNGVLQSHVTKCSPTAGRIGFQLEGAAYVIRAFSIEVL